MNKCIIISGKSGHGKDMLAHFMKEELEKHNLKVLTIHYADVLKYFLSQYYNYDGDKSKPENRALLQHVGTDLMRNKYPNYWTSIVLGFLSALEDTTDFDIALVPDARFKNEIDLLLENLSDVTTVRINRFNQDGTPWLNPLLTSEQHQHASETSLDNYIFDYTVINDDTIEMLHDNAIVLLQDLHLLT